MEHHLPFDPTYGYCYQTLREVGAPVGPEDLADFWQETYRESRDMPLRLTRRLVSGPNPARDVYEIEFDSLDGVRIGGWLTVPKGQSVRRGVVVGHGYGGREMPDHSLGDSETAALFFCARGFHRSTRADIPNVSSAHVLHGIESRDSYVHRGCCADLWASASALLELLPQVSGQLHYRGGSFGGGIGALALPWDGRFSRAYLDVPSFGNQPLRLALPCTGSGEAVRQYAQTHPEVIEVLPYFDAATAARHLRIPTLVGAALFDPAVPPPGQFAVYNAIEAEKRLFVRQAAHFEFSSQAEEEKRVSNAVRQWLG